MFCFTKNSLLLSLQLKFIFKNTLRNKFSKENSFDFVTVFFVSYITIQI